jgi:glycine/D-amino acid oxidase-like deaminating enzyme
MTRKAIIVGGGIAGLATARGLLELGWDVTIYENPLPSVPPAPG